MSTPKIIREALQGAGISDRPDLYDSNIHSWRCEHPGIYGHCSCLDDLVSDIHKALEATFPQIIRDPDDLNQQDFEALLMDSDEAVMSALDWGADYSIDPLEVFPLVVIATGDQVRAARKALQGEA